MIPQSKWEWFGTPGHFICAQWCRFHLCTKVGDYLISTVGEYVHPRNSGMSEQTEAEWLKENWPGEDIGCDRKYETVVFGAGARCTLKECGCRLPEIASSELECLGTNVRGEATDNHMKLCRKYARRAAKRGKKGVGK